MASRRWRRAAIGVALVPGVLIPAAVAVAARTAPPSVIIGAPLTHPPDVGFGCATLPLATGAVQTAPGDTSSCTWSTPETPANPAHGLTTPPGDGTITGVRVWVGPSTGPMSFVVLEATKNLATQTTSCCEAVLVTQPVMPTPNEINAFRTNLPVRTDAPGQSTTPAGQVTDFLALAVLNASTPIPLVDETGSGLPSDELPEDAIQNPAPLQGLSEPVTTTSGYAVDMQATWVPGTPAPATPQVRFASGSVFVSRGYVHVPLRCRHDTCRGSIAVTLEPAPAGGRPIAYATGPFQIGQNLYRSIAIPLTADGAAAARNHERRSVSIAVTYDTPAGARRIHRRATVTF